VEPSRAYVLAELSAAGCVAPGGEADELLAAAAAGVGELEAMLDRRRRGEPLAWIVGSAPFCGMRIRVDPGVYVPRPHTEALALRAASLVRAEGVAVDLCTGSGAVAAVVVASRPDATVLATDRDEAAVACARRNGVPARLGDLDEPLPRALEGRVDVMTAVPPYVPSDELHLLPRDVVAYEPPDALDGGPGGTAVLEEIVERSVRWLRGGGRLLLELGGNQARAVAGRMSAVGLSEIDVHRDEQGRDRAIEARVGW
jgi:release factor glutamine methyltransferase